MKTKTFYKEKSFLQKIIPVKDLVKSNISLIVDSLEKGYYPFDIPLGSGSAHVIYNSEKGNYIANFFKEQEPENSNVSTGINNLSEGDLEKISKYPEK